MENERTFFTPRKIRVVGCLNCPYFRDRYTMSLGGEPEVLEEVKARCGHPSFKRDIKLKESLLDLPNIIPVWCPLEFETCDVCAK